MIVEEMDQAPFDAAAADYDHIFTRTLLGRLLREAVHLEIAGTFQAGDRILELGCGTGEDALWLAHRGVAVRAVDQSAAMIRLARAKTAGLDISFSVVDLNRDVLPREEVDGVFSNFGALNCVRDRFLLGRRLARVVRTGGRMVFVVMGRYCPWEWFWFLARGDARRAFRRLDGMTRTEGLDVFYPMPVDLDAEFAPYFRRTRHVGVGVLLPPTFAAGWIEQHPSAARVLSRLEHAVRRHYPATHLADHYLVEFERL